VTVLVGVRCTDGVVIGADSAAFAYYADFVVGKNLNQSLRPSRRGGRIIIASTGAVGLSQRFHGIVKSHWDNKLFQKPIAECLREITRATIQDFEHTGVPRLIPQQGGIGFGSLMAVVLDGKPQLIEFGSVDFQPEIKNDMLHFVAMGSGQVLAEPFMAFVSRVLWGGKPPDVQLGAFGLYWVLSHTIQYAPGGVGKPIKIAILKREKGSWVARSVEGDELQEPEQHVAEIEKLIAGYPKAVVDGETKVTPPPPPPNE